MRKEIETNARVFVVDDHPVVRKGLEYIIKQEPKLEICGEAESGQEALKLIQKTNPDIVILDLSLKDMSGLDLLKELKKIKPELPILILSMHDESVYAERVIRAGAMGYLNKENGFDQLVLAIGTILKGEVYTSPDVAARFLKKMSKTSANIKGSLLECLSDRELAVFELIGQGFSTSEIAKKWNRSIKTIETYRANLKQKLNLDTSAELIRFSVKWYQSK